MACSNTRWRWRMSVLPLVFSRRAMSTLPCTLDNGPCASVNFRCLWRAPASAAETESGESATELHPHRYAASSTRNISLGSRADPAQVVVGCFVKLVGPTSVTSGAYLDFSEFGAPSHDKSTL